MPKKPIKRGIKVFCLVLSTGFVYNWHVYRGFDDPLRGANYMYRLIFVVLFDQDIWDFVNVVLFCDAAFTSISLFRDLWDERGIGAVGPINAKNPANKGCRIKFLAAPEFQQRRREFPSRARMVSIVFL